MKIYEETIEEVRALALSIGSGGDTEGSGGEGELGDPEPEVQRGLQVIVEQLCGEYLQLKSDCIKTVLEVAEGVPVSSGQYSAPREFGPRDFEKYPAPKEKPGTEE